MILSQFVIVLAFIMQHTFINAREPILGEEGEKIEEYRYSYEDSNNSTSSVTSYLRGDSKNNSTIPNDRFEMPNRNLEDPVVSDGTYYIRSAAHGTYIRIYDKNKVDLTTKKPASSEKITITRVGGRFTLKSATHGERYLRVGSKVAGRRVDTQTYVGAYEIFRIDHWDDGQVTIRSQKFHNALSARKDNKLVTAPRFGSYEKFYLIPV